MNDERDTPAAGGLDPDVADHLADALAPLGPTPARADALKVRILAAARNAPPFTATPVTPGFEFVAAAGRRWEKRGLGVEMCTLHEDEHSRSILIRLKPGGVLPAHLHEMDEESLMLEGDAWIGNEWYLAAGDWHFAPAGVPHPDLRSPGGCVVYVRGARRYRPTLTPTLMQRLLRSFLGRD